MPPHTPFREAAGKPGEGWKPNVNGMNRMMAAVRPVNMASILQAGADGGPPPSLPRPSLLPQPTAGGRMKPFNRFLA